MKKLFTEIKNIFAKDKNVVVCSLIDSSGSTPREAGAKMVVTEDGSLIGTIGGGAVEKIAYDKSLQLHKTKQSYCENFELNAKPSSKTDMVCGGAVTVCFTFLQANELNIKLIDEIICALSNDEKSWLVMEFYKNGKMAFDVYDKHRGFHFNVLEYKNIPQKYFTNKPVSKFDEISYYVEPLSKPEIAYIFGGGHVGSEIVPLLEHIGFSVIVYDNRRELAQKENFPKASKVIYGDYLDIKQHIELKANDYVIVMSPGHQADSEILAQVLESPATYIGCIGSKNKIKKTREYLTSQGISESNIDRVHSPIGLDIKAETPAEIAISVVAEIIEHRAMQ